MIDMKSLGDIIINMNTSIRTVETKDMEMKVSSVTVKKDGVKFNIEGSVINQIFIPYDIIDNYEVHSHGLIMIETSDSESVTLYISENE